MSSSELPELKWYRKSFKNRVLLVDLLVLCFASGAWVGVSSTFLEVPLLVLNAPEGWSLPSYISVIVQLGNVGPIMYTLVQKVKKFKESHIILVVKLLGAVAALLMALFYDKTAYIFGAERSVALFVLLFFFAMEACTSSVLFMPYMGRFRDIYLITYLIGEGFSGFLAGVISLLQGVGGNAECIQINMKNSSDPPEYLKNVPPPHFGSHIFFFFVFFMFVLSFATFPFLDRLEICRKEYAAVSITPGNDYTYDENNKVKPLTSWNYNLLIITMTLVCLVGNGIFPSIQTFSCLPYGNVVFHLTVSLSSMAIPVACVLAMFLPHTSIRVIVYLSAISATIGVYLFLTAVMSPNPLFEKSTIGDILIISSWTLFMGLLSYVRLSITSIFRCHGGKSLVYIGSISQVGTMLGSVISFCVINFTNIFKSYEPC